VNIVLKATSQNSQKALEIGAQGRGHGAAGGRNLPRPINTAPCGMATRYTVLHYPNRTLSGMATVKALAQKCRIARASIPLVETNQPSDDALASAASLMNHCGELNHADYTGETNA
jgi:hypothetical protein